MTNQMTQIDEIKLIQIIDDQSKNEIIKIENYEISISKNIVFQFQQKSISIINCKISGNRVIFKSLEKLDRLLLKFGEHLCDVVLRGQSDHDVQLLQLERCFLALRLDPVPDEGRRHDVTGETERGVAGSGIAAAAGRNVRKISGSGLRTLLIQLQQER